MQSAFVTEEDIERGARLRQARRDRGYKTATEAADALNVSRATYLGHENGSRGFKHSAARYAAFYRVSLAWLWAKRGPMRVGQDDPIIELYEAIPDDLKTQAIDYWKFLAARKP